MIQFAHCSENVTQLGTMGESICEKRHDEIASFRHLVDFRFFTRWKKFLRTLCKVFWIDGAIVKLSLNCRITRLSTVSIYSQRYDT